MDVYREISEMRLKEEKKSEVKRNSNIYVKINSEGEDEEENIQHNRFCSIVKRYKRYDLLSIRNAQLSIHYPHCALRPELQALSIWTCRLRCELQYLGLWKIVNTVYPYGNCSCNGSCQSYACDGQTYLPTNSQILNSQMCYRNVQQPQQLHPLQTSSSPTLSGKKATRSRERFLNYQRCINTELIRAVSPSGGSASGEGTIHYHLNHQIKPAFIDHRSISSSHLMPAFAKRRMGHANALHGHSAAGSNLSSNGEHKTEHFYNDDEAGESSTLENSVKIRKDSAKTANNQNDYHLYKPSANSRIDKNDQSVDNQSGWINLVQTIDSDFPMSSNKVNNASSVNKKLMYERRIGSGRLVPREVSWDVRIGSNKQVEKENTNVVSNTVEKDKDMPAGEVDKLNNRNTSTGRYSDPRIQDRRIFDRRISSSEESNNGGNNSSNKRYTTTNVDEDRNNYDLNSQHQTPHFTCQRSKSFRRREYVEHKDHHRDFRDFREPKDSRESRESKEQCGDQHHNHHRDRKEEPEWYIEGPTSQHDTIELRGFEETDESQQSKEQQSSEQYSKINRKPSEKKESNINLSAKDNSDISSVALSNRTNIPDENITNVSSCNNAKETMTPNIQVTDINQSKSEIQQIVMTPEEFEYSDKRRSNVTELFFDNFLNIEALENTLIGSASDQSIIPTNDDGGTSRFSRWFFTNSSNTENSNDVFNNNQPNREYSNRLNKDIMESDFNSFMSFIKCNNFPTPELPKSLPSNVSALSVEELEARMRKMDSVEIEKSNSDGACQHLDKNEAKLTKRSERESETDSSQSVEINTQDVEAFRRLLDQLGKPRVDISKNKIPPNWEEQPLSSTTPAGAHSTAISPIPTSNSLSQSNMAKQEYIMKIMRHQQQIINHQQNVGKRGTPLFQHHHPQHRITQITPQQQTQNLSLMSVPHHIYNHHMPMILDHPQTRLDVQYLIQSVVREELSRSFLERELKNPNISTYTKEIISTVLKETSRYNLTVAGAQTAPDSIERSSHIDISAAPNHLMRSLARGEVTLNLLEHELNKLNNINIVNEKPVTGAFKDRSRCGTPLVSSINVASIPTSGSVIVPISSQVVAAQKQSSVLSNESISSDHHEDSTLHMPTQRELQMHTQAIMQNALFKKRLEMEQHEVLRRRQAIHKQHELEPESISQQHHQQSLNSNSTISQQGHQQPSRHINSPTPLAFTPTSVLRKMTADKETITSSTQTTTITTSSQPQTQPHLKITTHAQMSYQHSNQPRMILGGGNLQYINQQQYHIASVANASPQVSPQQKSQVRSQHPGPLKWSLIHSSIESNHSVLNNNKPLGRPILKGPAPIQTLLLQNAHNPMGQNLSNVNQTTQSIQAGCQIHKYPSVQQQPRQIVGQQFSTHIMKHQIPTSQQNNMQQQLLQQQRTVVMQHQQSDLGNLALLPPPAHHPACNDNNSVTNINYQRDGGLSPTSNQLAQWFSPELLAQASAGKLPLLNMNQALSLEEFERSIQHSSTAVNN